MRLRHDAGYCAAAIGTFVRQLVRELGGNQVGTVGAPEPRLLTVQVWDKSLVKAVEKAIREANIKID